MKSHKELTVWQKSMELVEGVYKVTKKLPQSETFGLASQSQRAAVGIPSSIAEGAKRNHRNEYIQYLAISNGSAAELETQLIRHNTAWEKPSTYRRHICSCYLNLFYFDNSIFSKSIFKKFGEIEKRS